MSDEIEIEIVTPPIADEEMDVALVRLTEAIVTNGHAEWTGGVLGGEFGYGAVYENDVFMLHPFCWCDRDDCPWCGWDEDAGQAQAPNFLHKPSGTTAHWYKWIGRSMEWNVRADWPTVITECFASLPERAW